MVTNNTPSSGDGTTKAQTTNQSEGMVRRASCWIESFGTVPKKGGMEDVACAVLNVMGNEGGA